MNNKLNPNMNWIIYDDNPILRTKSLKVNFPLSREDGEVIEKMVSYVDASFFDKTKEFNIKPGIGIAAIQLGVPKQIIYIHFKENDKEHKYLIANPTIIKEFTNKSFIKLGEGCLSVLKNNDGYSIRKSVIIVEAINLYDQKKIIIEADGFLSICLQHEIDHLNGILYYDRINKFYPFFINKKWEGI